MRFFAILLVVLGAGFGWAMWQGIDLATGWLVGAEVPAPDWLVLDELDEVESTSAEQNQAPPASALELEETIVATSELAPEPAATTSPLAPAQDPIAEAPTEADTTLAVSSETPARDTALPEPSRDVSAAEPVSSTPTVPEPAPEAASAEPEPPAAPEPAVELPATEPPATDAPAGERAQPVQAEAPQCNIEACAAAFQSFRASDCTYQPFEGPRQLCTQEPQAVEPLAAEAATQPLQTETLQCNIERCTAAFRSFRASDCTYQPFEGSRQLCSY